MHQERFPERLHQVTRELPGVTSPIHGPIDGAQDGRRLPLGQCMSQLGDVEGILDPTGSSHLVESRQRIPGRPVALAGHRLDGGLIQPETGIDSDTSHEPDERVERE